MSIHRFDARRDANEAAIVKALKAVGAKVWRVSSSDAGAPDLLVMYRGNAYALEVKTAKGKILAAQKEAVKAGVKICRTVSDALAVIGRDVIQACEIKTCMGAVKK